LKDSSPEEFLNALKVVRDGNIFLDAKVMPSLINSFSAKAEKNATCSQKTDAYAALSDRELEILSMKMRGVKDDEAAKSLNVSLETLQRLELEIKEKMFDLESRPISKRQTSSQSHVRFCETCESVYEPNIEVCPNDGSTLFDEQTSRWLGTILDGKYELLGFLGKGGGASVFKGNHHYLNQQVAIKIIHGEHSTDFTMLKRFRGEAEIASRLNHPNIVQVYDFGVVDSGTPYLVMEYLEGINLANRLRKINYMSPAEMLTIFWQTCSALEYAHQNKVVHRDVKPSNIFLAERSNGEQIVKLLDFGLAKSIEKQTASNALTAHGQIVGTPDYMSPESCRDGIYTQPSDIYSLGCTMFECLSGAPPFKGDTIVEVMYKHIHDPAPTLFTHSNATPLETSLAKIIAKCLEKNPNRRYNDATEIKNELLELPFTG
jgi:serine/threonine protein kinase